MKKMLFIYNPNAIDDVVKGAVRRHSPFKNRKTGESNMKKMLFIYNPNAGTGVLKPKLSDVLDIFVKAGYEVTVYPTQCYHDAMAKAESYTESISDAVLS